MRTQRHLGVLGFLILAGCGDSAPATISGESGSPVQRWEEHADAGRLVAIRRETRAASEARREAAEVLLVPPGGGRPEGVRPEGRLLPAPGPNAAPPSEAEAAPSDTISPPVPPRAGAAALPAAVACDLPTQKPREVLVFYATNRWPTGPVWVEHLVRYQWPLLVGLLAWAWQRAIRLWKGPGVAWHVTQSLAMTATVALAAWVSAWPLAAAAAAWLLTRWAKGEAGFGALWWCTALLTGLGSLAVTALVALSVAHEQQVQNRVGLHFGNHLRPAAAAASETPTCALASDDAEGPWVTGSCAVSIPPGHAIGEIEHPRALHLELWETADEHVMLQRVTPLEPSCFFRLLHAAVSGHGGGGGAEGSRDTSQDAFVYVHGFNNTFEDAVLRTAQIAQDTGFRGVPICYAWASHGEVEHYTGDEDAARASASGLRLFLLRTVRAVSPGHVHLVAHSMGNRVLLDALRQLAASVSDGGPVPPGKDGDAARLFDQIVLAAPDVNVPEFEQDAERVFCPRARRVTMYTSRNDQALQVSHRIHQLPRAGETGDYPVVVHGITTVEVSDVCSGHGYIGHDGHVIGDVGLMLRCCQAPQRQKSGLEPRIYWRLVQA